MKYKCEHCSKTFSTEKECLDHEKTHLPPYWKVGLKYYLYDCYAPKFTVTKVEGEKWDWEREAIKTESDGGIVWLSKCVRERKSVKEAENELKKKAIQDIQNDIGRLTAILEEVEEL